MSSPPNSLQASMHAPKPERPSSAVRPPSLNQQSLLKNTPFDAKSSIAYTLERLLPRRECASPHISYPSSLSVLITVMISTILTVPEYQRLAWANVDKF
ncbi:hypothetical protein BD769DRAFT_1662683 [Suillus cothurnatus]|nr:hypothetical protein BD769DRAFT_1662683 [Suillus cothurnatus]